MTIKDKTLLEAALDIEGNLAHDDEFMAISDEEAESGAEDEETESY